jgi:hypothetical protein
MKIYSYENIQYWKGMFEHMIRCRACHQLEGYKEYWLPVVAFGHIPNPSVALLSINPSYREFDGAQPPLNPIQNGVLRTELSDAEVKCALDEQAEYFTTGRHLNWFNPAEDFLRRLNTEKFGTLSFFDDAGQTKVINIDLIKCATKPTWTALKNKDAHVANLYIKNCAPNFYAQLAHYITSGLELLITNGRGAYELLMRLVRDSQGQYSFAEKQHLYQRYVGTDSCEIFKNHILHNPTGKKLLVVGTSQRISKDSRGRFRDSRDRDAVAKIMASLIDKELGL